MTDFQELLKTITQTVLIPLIIALAGYAVKWINAKANEIKAKTKDDTTDAVYNAWFSQVIVPGVTITP